MWSKSDRRRYHQAWVQVDVEVQLSILRKATRPGACGTWKICCSSQVRRNEAPYSMVANSKGVGGGTLDRENGAQWFNEVILNIRALHPLSALRFSYLWGLYMRRLWFFSCFYYTVRRNLFLVSALRRKCVKLFWVVEVLSHVRHGAPVKALWRPPYLGDHSIFDTLLVRLGHFIVLFVIKDLKWM